ncbi:WxL domain-containing protein [Furfurilactobacillus milii]|nr:WxL domain-containing protein [Furfurilactobacillus milii]
MTSNKQWLAIMLVSLMTGLVLLSNPGQAAPVSDSQTSDQQASRQQTQVSQSANESRLPAAVISQMPSDDSVASSSAINGSSMSTVNQDRSAVMDKNAATSRAVASAGLPISFNMKPVSRNPITFNGNDVTVPMLMDIPRTGTVNFYVMFWWGINQWVGRQTFTKTGVQQPVNFVIPANVIPRDNSIHNVSLFATHESGHQTGLINLILLSNVSGEQNGALKVVAPGNINFNQGQDKLTVDEAWGHQLPATIEGPQGIGQNGVGDNRLAVLDTYSKKQDWTLTAMTTQPLTGPDHEPLTNALFYARNGKHQPIEGTSALVATSNDYTSETVNDANNVVRGRQTNISGHWNRNNGLFLEVPYGIGGGETYSTTITWTLTAGVPNQ